MAVPQILSRVTTNATVTRKKTAATTIKTRSFIGIPECDWSGAARSKALRFDQGDDEVREKTCREEQTEPCHGSASAIERRQMLGSHA
jgi:hypothetical protein